MRALLEWLLGEKAGTLPPDSELGFRFNQSPEGWVVFLLTLGVLAFTTWIYYRDGRDFAKTSFRVLLGAFRVLLLAIVLLLFTEPVLLATRVEIKPSTVAVLVDDSFSMKLGFPHAEKDLRALVIRALGDGYKAAVTLDDGSTAALPVEQLTPKQFGQVKRIQVVCQALRKGKPNFFDVLKEQHEIRFFTLHRLTAPSAAEKADAWDATQVRDLEPRAPDTRLGDGLRQMLRELRGLPLAAVVLVSDGRQNAGEDPVQVAEAQLKAQRIPLFTVSVGDPSEPKDIELSVEGPEAILPEDPAEVIAYVRQVGGYDKTLGELRVDLRGPSGDSIAAENVKLGQHGEKVSVPLKFRVAQPGKYVYTLSVPLQEGELREDNNQATYAFRVVDRKMKVLYVEGQDLPRWEYRYLKNALLRDHTTEADILLATGDGTFIWEGSPGKSPLDTFPVNEREINEYFVIIIGDVAPLTIFTQDQVKLIQKFVREGGGLILIAGARHMPSDCATGPFAELLPVMPYTGRYEAPPEGLQESFAIELTEAGKQAAWTHLDPDDAVNRDLWQNMPKMWQQYWYHPSKRAKELATVIAVHPFDKDEKGNKMPLIVTMPYGQGRVLFLAVDELWRWRYGVGDRYHYRFYSQAIRYLSMAKHVVQKRFMLGADKSAYSIGDKVRLDAHIKDANFKPLTDETVTVRLETPSGEKQSIEMKRLADREGAYEGHFYPSLQGNYTLWLVDRAQPDQRQSEISFRVDVPQLEMENPRMNEELLKALATAGGQGGRYFTIDQLNEIPKLVQPKEERIPREVPIPLWDRWFVLVLFTLLITLEWVLRKHGRML